MCDTMVALQSHTADGSIWFAKNSDREPGEAQTVEHLQHQNHLGTRTLQCTYIEIPQAGQTNEIILSRPIWMWGAEIGTNEHGVTIGNEAVWTKLPVEKIGLTGMDLLRLALERTTTAREALEFTTSFLQKYGQGGACGYRNKKFRYHNSFILADPTEAWVLETAGEFWAAEKVRGIRTISNALSIGKEFDLISKEAYPFAKRKGWCKSINDFDFAHCFGEPNYRKLSGGDERSTCTLRNFTTRKGQLALKDFFETLRDHNGLKPQAGWRMRMPCAHSSWHPTRRAGQTVGSMVSRLRAKQNMHWLTGTSSPCLSVFKPLMMGGEYKSTGPDPRPTYDANSLFWQHERLHRLVLKDYETLKEIFTNARMALEASFVSSQENIFIPSKCQEAWDAHLQMLPEWINNVEKASIKRNNLSMFQVYWSQQEKLDGMIS